MRFPGLTYRPWVERVKWRSASSAPQGGRRCFHRCRTIAPELHPVPTVPSHLQPILQLERTRTLATYKKIEVVGTSSKSVADAVKSAVSGAGKSVRNMSWFEVAEIRGAIKGGEVSEFQVTVRIGFKVES